MMRKIRPTHKTRESIFFKLSNRRRLAALLYTSPSKLVELTDGADRYEEWTKKKKSGGTRQIEAPAGNLKRIQARIADLLSRIAPPDFLFAPVKGRSYVGNASRHRGARQFHKLDIADFYPSCTANRVAWFFRTYMQCSPDVAAILVKLTTRNGRLPQGSPCSPILAYFAYIDMWEEIDRTVSAATAKVTVYVDDITISGAKFDGSLIWRVKQIIKRYDLCLKDDKEAAALDSPVIITGVVVRGGKVLLPNRQHQKLAELRSMRDASNAEVDLVSINRQITGRLSQARQVENGNL